MQSLQFSENLKKVIYILSTICLGFLHLNAALPFSPDEKKPGDDKKAKAKREDTTKFVISQDLREPDDEETPDTTQILFPSHDLYASWDTNEAHPYKFSEVFKDDSVSIQLVGAGDNGFVMPFRGPLTSLFGWRKYRPHYGT